MSSETGAAGAEVVYRVTSGGLTLTGKDGQEQDLATGARITRAALVAAGLRAKYIDTLVRVGDLEEVAPDA